MGIFDNYKSNKEITTKDFYFGSPEAEGENVTGSSLIDYFEDYLGVIRELERNHFIFIGRKGVGKSAIAKFIKDTSDKKDDSHAAIVRIGDYNKERIIQSNNSIEISGNLVFEWLILINIVKLIVKSECGKYTEEFNKLRKFLERNTGSVEIDKFETTEIFIKNGGEINFEVLRHVFNGTFKNYFDTKTTRAPFYKLINPLKEIVRTILSFDALKNDEYWLLFDDLDINYDINSVENNDNVIELLRIARNYNNELLNVSKAKILVFLREDMYNVLVSRYSDSAKLFNSYCIPINWYNHMSSTTDENTMPLKRMINKRIEINFKNHNIEYDIEDPWTSLVKDNHRVYGKSSFKYILDYTFYRPRDIITFLTVLSKDAYKYPVDDASVKVILKNYINTNILEIKSELSIFFNEEEKDYLFTHVFKYVASNNNITYDDMNKYVSEFKFNLDSEKVLDILIEYNLLIYKDISGRLIINYREDNIGIYDKDNLYLCLHKCLYHYYKTIYY